MFFYGLDERGGVLSAELHVHSSASHDGRDSIDLILEQARAVGLDAIALTDHDHVEAAFDLAERAPAYDLVGIPGIEVTSTAGHVIGLGVDADIPAGQPFEETAASIHEAGGIAVVPHPFQGSRHGVLTNIDPGPVVGHADAIEIYNSRLLTGRSNRQAERFADRHGLAKVAGSDAHICEMVGQAVTYVETDDRSVAAILAAIADGRTQIEGKRTPWLISFRQAAGGVKRRLGRHLP